MGGAGFQNQARQLGSNVSFAQSLSGSQPATPLDLSYVPAALLLHFFPPSCPVPPRPETSHREAFRPCQTKPNSSASPTRWRAEPPLPTGRVAWPILPW